MQRWRWVVRIIALVVLAAISAGIWPSSRAAMLAVGVSPYVFLSSTIARLSASAADHRDIVWGVGSLAGVVSLAVLLAAVLRRRWFCAFVCPVGTLSEPFRWRRIGMRWSSHRWPPLGRWTALATLASAGLGYPLALWLDPMAIFAGTAGLGHTVSRAAGAVAGTALAMIVLSNLVWPHGWCRRVCPLGATQELVNGPVHACVRARRRTARQEAQKKRNVLPRRSILAWGGSAIAAAAGVRAVSATATADVADPRIRPPGASRGRRLMWLCTRCGNCARVCPEGIIYLDQSPQSPLGYFLPLIRFRTSYCRESCQLCTEACPSGALKPLLLDEKRAWQIGMAAVDMGRCLLAPENGERECAVCEQVCPYQAVEYVFDYDTYVTSPAFHPTRCIGCGACVVACPVAALSVGGR